MTYLRAPYAGSETLHQARNRSLAERISRATLTDVSEVDREVDERLGGIVGEHDEAPARYLRERACELQRWLSYIDEW